MKKEIEVLKEMTQQRQGDTPITLSLLAEYVYRVGRRRSSKGLTEEMVRRMLIDTGGNKKEAADKLGVSRRTLIRKIKEWNITTN